MNWVPLVFVAFKLLVFGIGMFYAIKWHYDQGKKRKGGKTEFREVARNSAKAALIFSVALIAVGLLTYWLSKQLDLNLN